MARAPGIRARADVTTVGAAAAAGLGVFVVYSFTLRSFPALDVLFNDWLYNAVLVLGVALCLLRVVHVPTDRTPWLLLTTALASWAVAEILFAFVYDNDPPFPSVADAFYLAFYPLCWVGLLLLVKRHIAEFHPSLWLDGATAALAAAALGAAVLVEVVLQSTEGSSAAVITNIAYPVSDVLLLGLVIGVFTLSGWRPGRMWLLIGLGLWCTLIADAAYLFQSATDSYIPGSPTDAFWLMGMLLIAWAAWQTTERSAAAAKPARPLLATPALAGLAAIAILLTSDYQPLNPLALGLAVVTLAAVMVRTGLTFRENARMLERIHRLALTDALTGLANRRSLLKDLDYALDASDGSSHMLVIFDLNGFKRYNDTFGHPSGDALLKRLGASLVAAVGERGMSYRLGGDEFCVLADIGEDGAGPLLDAAVAALSEEGEAFAITTSFGAVFVPDEATTASEALRLADQRLYVQKHAAEIARSRPHEVLLQALSERQPELLEHSRDVARLSLAVGKRLGLSDDQLGDLHMAAELHDVGKLAIPDAILLKPGPLTPAELEFVHRHTLVGQRIVAAAPALQEVGRIVRASHERWDGTGYVDGLVGTDIPLAARIIAVCDSFKAMTTKRPYGFALLVPQAVAELRRSVGTQFDPDVVSAFIGALEAGEITVDTSPGADAQIARSAS
jgi:two-component system cell cycle response regulator